MKRGQRSDVVKSIDNALMLLEYLSLKGEGEKITVIAKDLGLSITATHRILKTMKERGFIEQDSETKMYRLGLNAQLLGISAMNQTNLYKYGLTSLNEINGITHETANIVIRNGWKGVYILQVQSPNPLRLANDVGSRVPLYCTAAGKTLLAHMNDDLRQRYYKEVELVPYTLNTLDSKEKLEEEFKTIKDTGIAYDREEQALGEACIATPVFGHNSEIVAAISISSPASRLTSDKMEQFSKPLGAAGLSLSEKLGFRKEIKG